MKYMGIDQYGQTYHGLTHPRKDLMERIGVQHATKMYRDIPNGYVQVGYIIGGLWIEIFEVKPWRKAA
jgi:hypothetical protein